jgi:hypothetical protein
MAVFDPEFQERGKRREILVADSQGLVVVTLQKARLDAHEQLIFVAGDAAEI